MHGTNEVVRLVAQANPGATVNEEKVRRVLRRGLIPTVRRVASRLVWSRGDVEVLCQVLGLQVPPSNVLDVNGGDANQCR